MITLRKIFNLPFSLHNKDFVRKKDLLELVTDINTEITSLSSDIADIDSVVNDGVKRYKALLTQTGTNAPVATVLQNSLGVTPTYGYTDIGIYTITATSILTLNKTAVSFGSNISINDVDSAFIQSSALTVNGFTFTTFDVSSAAFNGILNNTPITIEVYP